MNNTNKDYLNCFDNDYHENHNMFILIYNEYYQRRFFNHFIRPISLHSLISTKHRVLNFYFNRKTNKILGLSITLKTKKGYYN